MIKIHKYTESFVFVECELQEAREISKQFEFYSANYMFNPKYKLGVWDGKIRLFSTKTCLLPQGLLPKLIKYFKEYNIKYKIEDKEIVRRGPKIGNKSLRKFEKMIKLPDHFEEREHQDLGVQMMLYLKKTIILSATNSGKSLIAYLLFNILKYMNEDFKFLMMVPNVQLVEQMTDNFCEYGENFADYNEYVHKIYAGKQKNTDKPVTISTWQSLQNENKKYFQQFDLVMVDECHTAAAKVMTKLVSYCENAQYKIGMSGTLNDTKIDLLQLQGLFGPIHKIAKTKDMIKKGYSTKLKINGVILNHPKMVRDQTRLKKSKKMVYDDEVKFVNQLKSKQKYICGLANSRKNNTLVLFRLTKFGKEIRDLLEKYSKKKIFYVDGSVKVKYRKEAAKYCEENNDAIVIASYGTFSTGISIKNLHNIIFAESMKSAIKILQSIGRLLRIHKDKKVATVFDITDNLSLGKRKNYLLKHFLKRIGYYESEGHDYTITDVKLK